MPYKIFIDDANNASKRNPINLLFHCVYLHIKNLGQMDTTILKEELHQLIEKGDESFVKNFYKLAKSYLEKARLDQMIMEGEEDIKAGRVYSSKEIKDFIDSWN